MLRQFWTCAKTDYDGEAAADAKEPRRETGDKSHKEKCGHAEWRIRESGIARDLRRCGAQNQEQIERDEIPGIEALFERVLMFDVHATTNFKLKEEPAGA
jgi:hypothetical protein